MFIRDTKNILGGFVTGFFFSLCFIVLNNHAVTATRYAVTAICNDAAATIRDTIAAIAYTTINNYTIRR